MKLKPILILFACTIAMGGTSSAEVPSLINYQGRLTGPGGTPASGAKNFELKVYDAQAGGNLLYTEDVGTITLGEGGVYSFQFGGSGTSMATRSETLATTDGTLTVFNHALSATALPGSVAMSDGTFTWSQSAGSSAPANFIGSFIGASGIASAIYIQGAPAAGTPIEVTYQYEDAGIVGALSSGSSHWLELTINGDVQATRERVLAVPFALKSNVSDLALAVDESNLSIPLMTLSRLIDEVASLGLDGPSYRWEDFPRESLVEDGDPDPRNTLARFTHGRNGQVEQSTLLMSWANNDILTTRSVREGVGIFDSQADSRTIPVSGYLVATQVELNRVPGSARFQYIYLDGTTSPTYTRESFGTDAEGNAIWTNPFPDKAVKSIKGYGADNNSELSIYFTPIFDTTKERSVEIRLEDLPDGLFALNGRAAGSASEGKTFADCLKWRVRYSDGTLSDPQDLGSVIQIAPGKTPSHARVMTVPAILQDGSVDITKIIVRLVTK